MDRRAGLGVRRSRLDPPFLHSFQYDLAPMSIPRLVIKPESILPITGGHPWVFRDAVQEIPADLPAGEETDILDERGNFIGRGFSSPGSRIVVRIATRKREPLDEAFFRKRIKAAHDLRRLERLPSKRTDAYRLVFADADRVPGLTVDRLNNYISIQTPTAGMDKRKGMIVALLLEMFRPAGICERNDMGIREHEGLQKVSGWLAGEPAGAIRILENGISYEVDPLGAMKTGHFCDQRENRQRLEHVVRGKTVLDLFCYTGGFGLAAARAGAAKVLSVDGAEGAVRAARRNAEINGLADRIEHRVMDAFEALREFESQKRPFDVVVLDPPAFAKSKEHVENAVHAYKDINRRALRLLGVGGVLLTCSCSYHVGPGEFRRAVLRAAGEAGRLVRLIEEGGAGPDHPVLLNVPETDYLKSLLLRVVEKL